MVFAVVTPATLILSLTLGSRFFVGREIYILDTNLKGYLIMLSCLQYHYG